MACHQDLGPHRGWRASTVGDQPEAAADGLRDEWRLHNVWDYARLDEFTGKGGALEAAIQAREEGLVRNLSISCHTDQDNDGAAFAGGHPLMLINETFPPGEG